MDASSSLSNEDPVNSKGKAKEKTTGKKNQKPSQSTKLRGRDHDSPDVRISKTLSWLLRHVADAEGLEMRTDGYVKVSEIVSATPKT
jgi:2'-phosphotransferase